MNYAEQDRSSQEQDVLRSFVHPPPLPVQSKNKRLTVLYIVEHPNQEGDTCIDWTSQYCWTNGWNCLWRGHSVYRNQPLIPLSNPAILAGLKAVAL